MFIGYIRVSKSDGSQLLDLQKDALIKAGVEPKYIYEDLGKILRRFYKDICKKIKMRKIKMIWDFRGPEATPIAQHHQKHLEEFIQLEKLDATAGFQEINEVYALAFMIIEEKNLIQVRDALKPHRAEVAE